MPSRGLLQSSPDRIGRQSRVGVPAAQFDRRCYGFADVRAAYGDWAKDYDDVVSPKFGLRFLEDLDLPWGEISTAVDLACGTGMAGPMLAHHDVSIIDGVDFTEPMIEQARSKNVYRQLVYSDLFEAGLNDDAYGLVLMSLAHEHICDIGRLYSEFSRLVSASGHVVIIGYHPYFQMLGIPTHYHGENGNVAIESWVHQISDHIQSARSHGLSVQNMIEQTIDENWISKKPRWKDKKDFPISFCLHFHQK